MRKATILHRAGHWPVGQEVDCLVLDYDQRHRRRRRFAGQAGADVLLDLADTTILRDGDGLELEDGSLVRITAAPEALIEITASSPMLLMRLAWHLGNRHLPACIEANRILIRDDHVIVAMLQGLGAKVRAVSEPFDPEGGAYGQHNHDHGHHHHHDDDHHHHHSHG